MSKESAYDKLDFKALSRAIQDTQLGEVRLVAEEPRPSKPHKPLKIPFQRAKKPARPKPIIQFPRKTLAVIVSLGALFGCAVLIGMAIAKRLPPRISTQQVAALLPSSYNDCMGGGGEKVGGYGCRHQIAATDRLAFAACQVSQGYVQYVGSKPESCSLVYLHPEFTYPTSYLECANNQGVFPHDEGPTAAKCQVIIDGQGVYTQSDLARLIAACPEDGRKQSADGSPRCELTFFPDEVWLAGSLQECRYFGGRGSDDSVACRLRYTASDLFRYPELYGSAEILSELFVRCWEQGGFHGVTPWGVASCELLFASDGSLISSGQTDVPVPAIPNPALSLELDVVERQIIRPDVPVSVSGVHTLFGAVKENELTVVEAFSGRTLPVEGGAIRLSDFPEGEHRLVLSARVGDQQAQVSRLVVVDATAPLINSASYRWCEEMGAGQLVAQVADEQTSLLAVRTRNPQGGVVFEKDVATQKTIVIEEMVPEFVDSLRLEVVDAAGNTTDARLVPEMTCQ